MAILPIIEVPDPRLKQVSEAVQVVDADVARLMDDMMETMHDAPGIGLAVPQVGVFKRVIVVDIGRDGGDTPPLRLANPKVVWASEEIASAEEGCLSVPSQYADVDRPKAIRLSYLDETGAERELEADGLLARVIQHEIDHMDGVLFIDYLSRMKRSMMIKRVQKRHPRVTA